MVVETFFKVPEIFQLTQLRAEKYQWSFQGQALQSLLRTVMFSQKTYFKIVFQVNALPGYTDAWAHRILQLWALIHTKFLERRSSHQCSFCLMHSGKILPRVSRLLSTRQELLRCLSFFPLQKTLLGTQPFHLLNANIPFSQYHHFACEFSVTVPLQISMQTIRWPTMQSWNIQGLTGMSC